MPAVDAFGQALGRVLLEPIIQFGIRGWLRMNIYIISNVIVEKNERPKALDISRRTHFYGDLFRLAIMMVSCLVGLSLNIIYALQESLLCDFEEGSVAKGSIPRLIF